VNPWLRQIKLVDGSDPGVGDVAAEVKRPGVGGERKGIGARQRGRIGDARDPGEKTFVPEGPATRDSMALKGS